jgi:hypothetical protein
MTKLLLAIHVLAAIIAIGPVTVAASMYPAATRRADLPTLRTLHRICRVYAALGVVVPVFGLATATSLGVLGDAWLLISIVLTVLAAAILALLVLPRQAEVLAALAEPAGHPGVAEAPARKPGVAEPTTHKPAVAKPPIGNSLLAKPPAGKPGVAEPPTGNSLLAKPPASNPRLAAQAGRLGMLTGIFNLLWTVVVVLMIVRPGSTTGA